jgi:nucleotide-binding universal stress UspA family protein
MQRAASFFFPRSRVSTLSALRQARGVLTCDKPAVILVGLSDSIYGDCALRAALRVARPNDTLTGIYVPAPIPKGYRGAASNILESMNSYHQQLIDTVIGRATEVAKSCHVPFTTELLAPTTDTKRALVQACADLKADLIVIGSHGRSTKVNYGLTDTSEYVILNAPCGVLVVKLPPH